MLEYRLHRLHGSHCGRYTHGILFLLSVQYRTNLNPYNDVYMASTAGICTHHGPTRVLTRTTSPESEDESSKPVAGVSMYPCSSPCRQGPCPTGSGNSSYFESKRVGSLFTPPALSGNLRDRPRFLIRRDTPVQRVRSRGLTTRNAEDVVSTGRTASLGNPLGIKQEEVAEGFGNAGYGAEHPCYPPSCSCRPTDTRPDCVLVLRRARGLFLWVLRNGVKLSMQIVIKRFLIY